MKELIQQLAGLVYEANKVKDKYDFRLDTSEALTELTISTTAKDNHGYHHITQAWVMDGEESNINALKRGITFLQSYLDDNHIPEWMDDNLIKTMRKIAERNNYPLTEQDIAEIFDREV